MAAAHYTLTLSGAVQRLSSVLQAGVPVTPARFLSLQADPGNTHVVYVGGYPHLLSSTAYGWRIEVPATSIPPAPSIIELGASIVDLDDLQVLGTVSEVLHIFVLA